MKEMPNVNPDVDAMTKLLATAQFMYVPDADGVLVRPDNMKPGPAMQRLAEKYGLDPRTGERLLWWAKGPT